MNQLSLDGDDTAAALIPTRPSLKKLREAGLRVEYALAPKGALADAQQKMAEGE